MANITTHATLLSAVREEASDDTLSTDRIDRAIQETEDQLNADENFNPRFLRIRATDTMTADNQYTALPPDFKKLTKVILTGTTPQGNPRFHPPAQFDILYADISTTGQPEAFTLIGDEIKWGTKPDKAYAIEITYFGKISTSGPTSKLDEQKPLTSSNANWIITNQPNIYFHGVLANMLPYLGQKQRTRLGSSPTKFQAAVNALIGTTGLVHLPGEALYSQPMTPTP